MALQVLITLTMIVFATIIVWRRVRQMFLKSSSSGCGSCGGCSGGDQSVAVRITPLVQLGISATETDRKK